MRSRLRPPRLTHSHARGDHGLRWGGGERSRSGTHHGGRGRTGGGIGGRPHRTPRSDRRDLTRPDSGTSSPRSTHPPNRSGGTAGEAHRIAATPSNAHQLNPCDPSAADSGRHWASPSPTAGKCRRTHNRGTALRASSITQPTMLTPAARARGSGATGNGFRYQPDDRDLVRDRSVRSPCGSPHGAGAAAHPQESLPGGLPCA